MAYNFGTNRDILKIQTDLNSANQMLSLEIKFMFIESHALLKISKTQNPQYFGYESKFQKMEKVEVQSHQMGLFLKVWSKLDEKSGVRH
jgi:hypothetical protein